MATSDEITTLAKQVADGVPGAEAEFVAATIGRLRAVVGTTWAADRNAQGGVTDVVNSTYRHFLQFCRGHTSDIRNGEAALFHTARLRVLHRLRSRRAEKRDPEREARGDDVLAGLAADGPGPLEAAAHQEDVARLIEALARLPAEDQALLLRREAGGGTWEQIAAEAGQSVSTLKRRCRELLGRLRAELGEGA